MHSHTSSTTNRLVSVYRLQPCGFTNLRISLGAVFPTLLADSGYDDAVARKRILIVEDETITALHLCKDLDRLGYQVSGSATSGEEAVLLAEQLNPDLVIMDVKLAGKMDGVEASQRIQEKRAVPVVYLTSYPDVFLPGVNRMQQPGLCLSKPFSSPALEKTIEIALASRQPPSAND